MWDLTLPLDERSPVPLFQQIARGVTDGVRRGRLAPGSRLPATRRLAEQLGVHRNTVIAAYDELEAQGWIAAWHGSGTFVSDELPDVRPRPFAKERRGVPRHLGYSLARSSVRWHEPVPRPFPRGVLSLAGGVPDLRLLDPAPLARAYRRALKARSGRLLDYGTVRGHPRLRASLAAMLNAMRGLAAEKDDVFVTRGSQMALYLVSRALVSRGDVVAVEALGYGPAWDALRAAGARVVSVPVDDDGMDVDRLAAIDGLSAVYLTPHHQFPTTAVLSPGRRIQLLALARRRRFAIIEDDYDFEMHYQGRPVLPLASADDAGVVVYVGTLSKILAPGLRIGYVVAPPPLLDRLEVLRPTLDRQGDLAMEAAVGELLEDGDIQRHVRKMRHVNCARRDALVAELERRLTGVVQFGVPPGGMALWVGAPDVDVDAWAERGIEEGVLFMPARAFAFDGRSRPFMRLAYSPLNEGELAEAVRRMARALPASYAQRRR